MFARSQKSKYLSGCLSKHGKCAARGDGPSLLPLAHISFLVRLFCLVRFEKWKQALMRPQTARHNGFDSSLKMLLLLFTIFCYQHWSRHATTNWWCFFQPKRLCRVCRRSDTDMWSCIARAQWSRKRSCGASGAGWNLWTKAQLRAAVSLHSPKP